MKDVADPFVSVIIPTRNRAVMLADCLRSLHSQRYPQDRYEVIVVDDGSTDGTPEVAQPIARDGHSLRIVSQRRGGINAARNTGIRAATGDLLCFLDDDVETPEGWLRAFVEGAARHVEADVFAGRIALRLEGRLPRLCGREAFWETELDLGDQDRETERAWGANFAMRRRAIDGTGLFDERYPLYGDEVEWELRYLSTGGRIAYIADAMVWHRRTADDLKLGSLMRRRSLQGRGRVYLYRAVGVGELPPIRADFEAIVRGVAHLVRRRCDWGLLSAAESCGRLWARAFAHPQRNPTP